MSDGWDRPPADGANLAVEVFEVPLSGSEPGTEPGDAEPTAPNWRRTVAVALVAGTVFGILGTIVMLAVDDDPDDPPSTVADPDLPVVTTPPTLRPLEALPSPDTPAAEPESASSDPVETVAPVETAPVVVPIYSEVRDVELTDLVDYDIAAAVDRQGDDIARRSDTHLELGFGGYVLDVSIVRDPVRDRYQVIVQSRDQSQLAIVDVATGTTYINPGTPGQAEVPNDEIIAGSTTTINEYFDRLLVGPVRPDTFNAAATRGRGLVSIDDIGDARQFLTTIPGELVPEWQLYAFSPVFEFPVEDRPTLLEYSAYVTEDGRIAQTDGVALIGDVPQLIQHRVTVLSDPPVIELPQDSVVAPTAPPSTTTPPDGSG